MNEHSPPASPDPLLPPNWAELEPLVDAVLDASPDRRASVLAEVSGDDPGRRAVLERLVSECERDLPLLNQSATERFDQLLTEDVPVALTGLIGDRYRIAREVGRGGMARVYLASDVKHGRDVAIKVVRAELAASLGRDRFLREIEIAARLRHPNIVPLYDSGDANGSLYFVMPFEEGPSLRARIAREGPLPVAEALSVLRDVARALQYAHARGVSHRDIKPDNVLMSGGAAVVADFGIAKAFTTAQVDPTSGQTTQTGVGIGTPAYVAPEQAVGDPSADHRADIYSFGCLAFELFTAHPPFHGLVAHQVIAAHVGRVPQSLAELRSDVPDGVARLVARCLEKNPDARPQNASDLLTALELPDTTIGLPRSPRSTKRALALVAIAVGVVIGAAVWLPRLGNGPPITLAVLPYVNIANDNTVEFFADGLGDEVATALARVPGIQIQSRGGARLYRGQLGVDVKDAGSKLAVDYVVTGSMRQLNGRWIVSTELTRTSDAAELWSGTFDRNPAQQLGVAEEIARAHAAELRRRFPRSLGVAPALAEHQKTSADAYRLYMLGQELLRRRGQSVMESAEAFRQAVALDSGYAGAHSGLSMALALYPYFHLGTSWTDVADEVKSSARRALTLDSTLAQPHVALGLIDQAKVDWDRAEAEYQTALRLQPNDPEALVQYGRHLLFRLKTREGLDQFQAARRADPASPLVLSWVSYTYYLLGQQDSARVISEQAVQSGALNLTTRVLGALVRLRDGRLAEARALVTGVVNSNAVIYYVLAASGDTATALARLRALESERPRPSTVATARAYTMLGLPDTAQALAALELATERHEIWPSLQPTSDPIFNSVRGSARFAAILRRVGIPTNAGAGRAALLGR